MDSQLEFVESKHNVSNKDNMCYKKRRKHKGLSPDTGDGETGVKIRFRFNFKVLIGRSMV